MNDLHDDADIRLANAQYREILEIPGYRLRKGIEAGMLEILDVRTGKSQFTASHLLPTTQPDMPLGDRAFGVGATEGEAGRALSKELTRRQKEIQRLRRMHKRLSPDEKLQGRYLDSLFYEL